MLSADLWVVSDDVRASELYKDWNDTCKPNFEAFVEADMQVIPSPP